MRKTKVSRWRGRALQSRWWLLGMAGRSVAVLILAAILAACGGAPATPTAAPAKPAEPTKPAATAPAAAATKPAEPTKPAATAPAAAATKPAEPTKPAATAPGKPAALPEPPNKAELAQLTGEIIIDGSSTVFPVTSAAAQEFQRYAPKVRIPVGISGTGGGFKKFCNGETAIQDASRPILPEEAETCKKNDIEYIELPVAYDGLAVMVNPQNTWTECLTVAELKKIWEPAAQGKITNWKQVRDSFPDRPLKLYGAGADSGTFDYFTEAIVGKAKSSRGDYQASEDDNVLVQGIAGDPNALGFFGYAYYQENASKLKLVAIDAKGDGKCVKPSIETVKDGSYQPLSRPIFIYVSTKHATRPEVKAFVNFYLSPSFTPEIQSKEVGYIALSDELYKAIAKRFNDGVKGSMFKGAEVGATLDRYLKP
jgi:phosphate transport system substrate-binding protein